MTDTLAHAVGVGWLRCNLKKEKKSCPRKRRIEFVPIRWQWQEHKPCLFYDGGFISKEKKNVLAPGKSSLKCVLWHLFHFPQFRHSRICLAFAIFVKTMSEHVWRLPCMPSPDDEAGLIFYFFFLCVEMLRPPECLHHVFRSCRRPPPCSEMWGDELGSTQSCCWRECHSARALDVCFSCCQINKSWIFHDCLLPLR